MKTMESVGKKDLPRERFSSTLNHVVPGISVAVVTIIPGLAGGWSVIARNIRQMRGPYKIIRGLDK